MGSLAASQLQGLRFDPELGLLYVPPHVCMGFLQFPKTCKNTDCPANSCNCQVITEVAIIVWIQLIS